MITMPMRLKGKWVAALRSGEYKQCANTLHDGTGYCCLGVLQAVAGGDVEPSALPSHTWALRHSILLEQPSWYVSLGKLPSNAVSLTALNDMGVTFTEIADIIEEQVEGV